MQNRNICKLVPEGTDEKLTTTKFILETEIPPAGVSYIAIRDWMVLVTEGGGSCKIGKIEYDLAPGCLIFIFAGQHFHIQDKKGLKYLYIEFYGSRANTLYSRFGINEENCLFSNMDGLIPIWKESLVIASGENIDLLSESMLLYAFSKLRKPEGKNRDRMQLIAEYLEDHFSENDCTLQSCADALGYNAKYLSHLIKRELKVGFSEHLKELRIRYAVLLMHQGVTSIKNIAILSGFTDPLYFSKVFRQEFGISPSEYIQNATEKTED